MDHAHDNPRRRDDRSRSPVESSSDELAAGLDRQEAKRRRTSWTTQKNSTPQHSSQQERRYSESEGTDEYAADADEYWRRSRGHRRSRSPINRPSDLSHDPERARESDRLSEDRTPRRNDMSDRSPTPVPYAPPPKPDHLDYREKFVLRGHLRGVSAVQFSPDCSMIASGGADAAVKVWDTRTGRLVYTFEGHLAGISTLAWSPDGQWIASGSDDKTIRLWNVNTGRAHKKTFIGHHNYVYQIAFAPKGNILVSGSYDEAVFLWDVRRARVMRTLPAHSDPVAGIDVVHDGTLIVSCALDGLVRVWDTHSGQCLRTLVYEDNPPATCVKFSPNGKYILAWTLDGCVRMWNYVESRVVKTFQGHVNQKYSLSGSFGFYGPPGGKFTPPLCFAVSGSEDGAILCWDIVSKNVLQRIEGHTDVVLGVHSGKLNGRRLLVSCGLDKTVRVWEEPFNDLDETSAMPDSAGDNTPNGISGGHGTDGDNAMTDAPDPSTMTPAEDVTMT
ncbi:WD repeat protein [Penicillium capsulatum]|uniref:WD repeat protein n=1 Tax=Penicillium capsulatum TaxID=69766 RepID=A0A9W9LVQ3_9EURO|nr:WD repeat protein [Penicillium capsulatum]KAJ6122383.1 WD repeat protein [Penicillium capsulatum]